jgi:hypothetical protein
VLRARGEMIYVDVLKGDAIIDIALRYILYVWES